MFRRSGSKAIGAMVVQTRTATSAGAVSGLIWTDGPPDGAKPEPNPFGRVRGLYIEGRVSGDADISVNGRIKGDVNVTSLTVDAEGVVEGRITAERVEVRGRVIGDIEAEVIHLHPNAFVQGALTYGRLSIELGAAFQGACRQILKASCAGAPAADTDFVLPPLRGEGRAGPEAVLQAEPDFAAVTLPETNEGLLN